jgi:GH15 family glucan-1,4-alpha-glucosidase
VRGPRRHFVHSKMMAWVAVDRLIKSAEKGRFDIEIPRWNKLRDAIHEQVCRQGFDRNLNSFVQYYGGKHLDASILMMPLVGFLPANDPRMLGTVKAIETDLIENGFVGRYTQDPAVDGIPHGEGTFLPCSFWLADNYELQGRHDEAVKLFERLLAIRNDVGLLSEEYDAVAHRQLGNFPQAFSLVGLVNTAFNLSRGSEAKDIKRVSEKT